MGAEGVGTVAAATNPDDGDPDDADCPPTPTTPGGGFGLPDRYGLAAAMISREIAYADADPDPRDRRTALPLCHHPAQRLPHRPARPRHR